MDNKCIGLMGDIFGHNYKSFLVSESGYNKIDKPMPDAFEGNMLGFREIVKECTSTEKKHDNKYQIVCKRCGKEINDNK